MSNIYEFGWPDDLTQIHFPSNFLNPIYWYWPTQQPTNFLGLGQPKFAAMVGQAFVNGADYNVPFYPVLKILPIDTQPIIPFPPYGASSLEAALGGGAIKSGNSAVINGQLQHFTTTTGGSAVGKFDFTSPYFWKVVELTPPRDPQGNIWDPYTRNTDKDHQEVYIKAANLFLELWNKQVKQFNDLMHVNGALLGTDWHSPGVLNEIIGSSPWGIQPPPINVSGSLLGIAENTLGIGPGDLYYCGAIDPGWWFAFLQILSVGYASTLAIGQLDQSQWNQSTFPPRPYKQGQKHNSKFGGKSKTPFPLMPPQDTAFTQSSG